MARSLDIVFCGLVCFDPQPYGYRVLVPDGRDPSPFTCPPHEASILVRPRDGMVRFHWPWEPTSQNEFPIRSPGRLEVTGIHAARARSNDLRDRLLNLQDADWSYELDVNAEAILDLDIDRGTLSAHEQERGMIVARWTVEADDATPVRFEFGAYWIEAGPEITQVLIANIGDEPFSLDRDSDFNLYRKLSTDRTTRLTVPQPRATPLAAIQLIEKFDEERLLNCPIIDCSAAFSRWEEM